MARSSAAESEARVSRAVWETVAHSGIEGTTVRSVAERAGCTTGLIMHRFGSRESMLRHARDLLFQRTAARADAAEASAPDARTKLEEVLAGVLTLDEDRRQEARVWLGFAAASIPDAALRDAHLAGTRAWRARINRLLSDCAPMHDDATLAAATLRLVATAEGLASLSILDPHTYTHRAQRTALSQEISAVIDGLRSPDA